jgi:hypothetical protein
MVSRLKRSFAADAASIRAARKQRIEQLEATICTYWPANPAFDPKRVLLRRLFFFNEDRTKYVSVGFYCARDYQTLVDFRVVRRDGGAKTIIINDDPICALAEGLPNLRDAMCSGEPARGWCKSGAFRLNVTRSRRIA